MAPLEDIWKGQVERLLANTYLAHLGNDGKNEAHETLAKKMTEEITKHGPPSETSKLRPYK